MKRLSPRNLKSQITAAISEIRGQRFFQDHLSLALLIPTLGFNLMSFIIMLVRLHPTTFPVPIHYSSLLGFDQLGPWYEPYRIVIFGITVTIVNTALAAYSFSRSRITSFYLLIGAFVVNLFCLIIGTAFTVVA